MNVFNGYWQVNEEKWQNKGVDRRTMDYMNKAKFIIMISFFKRIGFIVCTYISKGYLDNLSL